MTRWKITLEYQGGAFVGWQRQQNGQSVQAALEEALAKFAGPCRVTGAGRTDAGVHALGQVAHFDTEKALAPDTVRDALNAHLRPLPVAVLAAEAAPPGFDARFSATMRHYRYRIVNRRPPLTLERELAWHIVWPLDEAAMHRAAQSLLGRHDFTSFRAAACQAKSPVRTVEAISVGRAGDEVVLEVSARSFLHHQVRNFVGSLRLVGEGKWPEDRLREVLEARNRAAAGATAPPHGLYFVRVDY